MAVKSASRRPSVSSQTAQDKRWESVFQHLERGEYEHAINDLRKLSETNAITDQPYLESMIKTAYQLCLACIHFREEVDWHRKARTDADSREGELLQQLYSVLYLIEADSKLESGFNVKRNSIPSISTSSIKSRLQSFLGIINQERIQDLESSGSSSPILNDKDPVFNTPSGSGEQPSIQVLNEKDLSTEKEDDTEIIPTIGVELSEDLIAPETTIESLSNEVPPSLVVYCLGPFKVYQDDHQVTEWLSSKGRMVFKYLITHREHPIPKEILMDLFWPNTHPDAARNNLNVAIYGLRQALHKSQPNFSHVLFQNAQYTLNPSLRIWVDVEEFEQNLAEAQNFETNDRPDETVKWLESAINLYHGDFLAGDIYEEWTVMIRERLRLAYLNALHHLSRHYFQQKQYSACAALCQIILARDNCREDVHCLLMRCFAHQGQTPLGLRQYQICVEALLEELGVGPSESTVTLYKQLKRHEITKSQSIS